MVEEKAGETSRSQLQSNINVREAQGVIARNFLND